MEGGEKGIGWFDLQVLQVELFAGDLQLGKYKVGGDWAGKAASVFLPGINFEGLILGVK